MDRDKQRNESDVLTEALEVKVVVSPILARYTQYLAVVLKVLASLCPPLSTTGSLCGSIFNEKLFIQHTDGLSHLNV